MKHDPPWDDVEPEVEAAIRRDERHKLAAMLREHSATLASFAGGTGNTIELVAFMLELDR